MLLTISHETLYRFDQPVRSGLQELRLTPVSSSCQRVVSWETEIDGGVREAAFKDQHGNRVELISLTPGRSEIRIHSRGQVDTTDTGGVTAVHDGFTPLWLFRRHTALTRPGPGVGDLARRVGSDEDGPDGDGSDEVARMHDLARRIGERVTYTVGTTHAGSTAEEVLAAGHGVCQDHAHLFISAARVLGFPARYVSGYLMMDDRVDQDASHGWAEVWLDGLGWVGFDVSNGICPDDRYVRVATGLDYREAAPVSGVREGDGGEHLSVAVQVQQQ